MVTPMSSVPQKNVVNPIPVISLRLIGAYFIIESGYRSVLLIAIAQSFDSRATFLFSLQAVVPLAIGLSLMGTKVSRKLMSIVGMEIPARHNAQRLRNFFIWIGGVAFLFLGFLGFTDNIYFLLYGDLFSEGSMDALMSLAPIMKSSLMLILSFFLLIFCITPKKSGKNDGESHEY